MTPRLESCYFDETPERAFTRMAGVLAVTAARHCPGWQRRIEAFPSAGLRSPIGIPSHEHNTQKLARWVELVQTAEDGEHILLLDADTCILRSLDDAWAEPFDLAYTTKRRPFPFNLGVLFVRVSEPVRAFFRDWREENDRLFREPGKHFEWRQRSGGVNQASFQILLDRGGLDRLAVKKLPCAEWNCEESTWETFNPALARVLHVKGALRRAIFGRPQGRPELVPLMKIWRDLDREVNACEERTA